MVAKAQGAKMEKKAFLLHLDSMLELTAGTLNGNEKLNDLVSWDSLAVLGFIALVDKELDMSVSPDEINRAGTVNDLLMLLGDKVK